MFCKSKISEAEYKKIFNNITPELRILLLFTNLTCNARCNFCHIWGDKGWALKNRKEQSLEHIDLKVAKRFIDEALSKTGKPFWVMLTGGEPTLYKNFENLVGYLKRKELPIILLTNGYNLADRAEFFVKNEVNNISISLDGPPEVHNKIRNINNLYDEVIKGVEKIIKLKYEHRSIYPMLFFNCVISKHTMSTIKDFIIELRKDLKTKKINLKFNMKKMGGVNDVGMRFEPLLHTTKSNVQRYINEMKTLFDKDVSSTPHSFIQDNRELNLNPIKIFLEDVWTKSDIKVDDLIEINDYFHNIDNTFNHKRCFAPWHSLIVRQNGDTYFCPDFKDYELGNINENSFSEIWQGQSAAKFRKVLSNGLLALCNRCGGLYTDYQFLYQNKPQE